jgi:hypothetical protein
MSITLVIFAWAAFGTAAYFLAKEDWTRDFDFTTRDRVFFVIWSLGGGPFSFLVQAVFYVTSLVPRKPERVLKKRKGRD